MSFLLDIVEVAKSHTGNNIASAFAEMLREFGIEDKILGVTTDNTSNNNTMIKKLSELVKGFPGAANQTCCFTHILNLTVQDKGKDGIAEEEEEGVGDMTADELAGLEESLQPLRCVLVKICALAKAVHK